MKQLAYFLILHLALLALELWEDTRDAFTGSLHPGWNGPASMYECARSLGQVGDGTQAGLGMGLCVAVIYFLRDCKFHMDRN